MKEPAIEYGKQMEAMPPATWKTTGPRNFNLTYISGEWRIVQLTADGKEPEQPKGDS